MSYEVGFKPSALREVRKLDEVTRKAIISEVELLTDNPRPDGCKKLKGESNLYRIRVLSNYRVVYVKEKGKVEVLWDTHRSCQA